MRLIILENEVFTVVNSTLFPVVCSEYWGGGKEECPYRGRTFQKKKQRSLVYEKSKG